MIDRLLLERVPLAGIARVMQVSENWLQRYVNRCYGAVPREVQVQPKAKGRLEVQMDELWSFVDDKGNKQWVWLALDVATREIVGCPAIALGTLLELYGNRCQESIGNVP